MSPRNRPEPPSCSRAGKWLRANYGDGVTAPLTGTDVRALHALAHVWDLWACSRDREVLDAARIILQQMQPKMRNLAVALVPMAADWSDELHVRSVLAEPVVMGVSLAPMRRIVPTRERS